LNASTEIVWRSPQAAPVTRWLREGLRVALFRRPDWNGLAGSPAQLAGLVLADYLLVFVVERAMLHGHPRLIWTGILSGWASTVVNLWLAWILSNRARTEGRSRVDATTLFTLLCALCICAGLILGAVFIPLGWFLPPAEDWPMAARWLAWLAPMVWVLAAQALLYGRLVTHRATRALALLVVLLSVTLGNWLNPVIFWQPEWPHEASRPQLSLTQEVLEAQPRLLAAALDGLRPQRAGAVDVYAITYAPYAREDVFMRESAAVARTMARRFDAGGRTVQLVDNPATALELPWATPLNLQRTIARMAATMNRDEDVLFLHLTSHGGSDGELATAFWPLEIDPVTPQMLKRWLDDAGVRWRVVSVSACFSGSWIEPLAGDGTLVMTAADATHTSFGCGSKSPLTFFGQAMYVDALQSTRSFEQAHAQARTLIARREREAGKEDGYSNPQISMGAGVRTRLATLAREREAADAAVAKASAR
jgi:hypothetical protein